MGLRRLLLIAAAWLPPLAGLAEEGRAPPGPGAAVSPSAGPPGRLEIRLEPVLGSGVEIPGLSGSSGVSISTADSRSSLNQYAFGLNAGVGFLVTAHAEPGVFFQFLTASVSTGHSTSLGMGTFFKFNFWATARINPFIEPFFGFLTNDSELFFRCGLSVGLELLIHRVGLRIWTGFEAFTSDNYYAFGAPVRWALVAYF
jgi:hypothetical protein